MKIIKNFEMFLEGELAPAPARPRPATTPSPERRDKPQRPTKPAPGKIDRPSVDPDPKAIKKSTVKAEDVAKRFLDEMNAAGESVEKYMK